MKCSRKNCKRKSELPCIVCKKRWCGAHCYLISPLATNLAKCTTCFKKHKEITKKPEIAKSFISQRGRGQEYLKPGERF